ncbi:uncharacterized protein LOC134944515 isoform X1 [Pseudophryne corroboree]|uniref:uncharacterized protein LOC134944515 isoform X1 n=1 Tax=Pseudophryne corroboree TaxID=495146 RepID=UPI003081702B
MQSVSPTEARNMGHIAESDFPQQAGHYSVINLRMLAAALGFPNDVIESSFPPGSLDRGGISSQGLRRLLDQGCLTSDLHFTYNMKSGLYNVNLIIKCLDLLDSYTISFTGIQEARVAFSAYEHLDQKGVRTETNILLKIVKMSGCGVSPQKLSLYLKQRSPSYVEAGRVQLYEFLDLLAICEPRKKFFIQEGRLASTDKARGLYQMDDVRSSVLTPDEKLTRHLNWRFQHVDSWMLPQATTAAAKPCSFRICQQTETLNETRPQPPRSKNEASFVQPEDSWTLVTPVPHLKCRCYTPKRGDPILTEQEIQKTQNDIEDLTYQMETLGERSHWEFNWKLDHHLPGYRRCSTTWIAGSQPSPSIKKKRCKDDVFTRLSAPRRRMPSPCHATSCNAYELGIANKTQRERPKCSTANIPRRARSTLLRQPPRTSSANA